MLILIVLGTFHPITEDDSRLVQADTSHSLTWQEGSETPRSVSSSLSSSNTKNHNNSDLTNYNRRKQISVTPMIVRKFSFQSNSQTPTVLSYNPDPGVTLSDTECDNKENEVLAKSDRPDKLEKFSCRVKTRSSSIRRRCSSYFTPLSKRSVGRTGRMSGSVRALDRSDLTEKKLSEIASGGRLIPLKQGYMYKKSVSGIYKRKYVSLCSDSVMTYYPSFQAYIDNVDGKEIQLSHVTVKIPGKKPSGLKTCSEGSTESEAQSRCDKEDLTLELCQPELDQDQPSQEKDRNKRKRLSTQSESSVTDLQLVSLDGSIWQFQMCTLEEVEDWEKAIQGEILNSLCSREVLNLDHIRNDIPGNTVCADCDTNNPDWASINLGILICIECSGIHRNLGSHISKVRSLSLDCWSQMNIKTLENIGNRKANQFWERNIQQGVKPEAKSCREIKVNFIKSKYVDKLYCTFDYVDLGEENSIGALI